MTQTGGLVILFAWLIFAGLLAILAYLLLRHEQDPLQDLSRPGPDQDDGRDDRDPSKSGSKPLPGPITSPTAPADPGRGRYSLRAGFLSGRLPDQSSHDVPAEQRLGRVSLGKGPRSVTLCCCRPGTTAGPVDAYHPVVVSLVRAARAADRSEGSERRSATTGTFGGTPARDTVISLVLSVHAAADRPPGFDQVAELSGNRVTPCPGGRVQRGAVP
jgi:hypothetical protein